MPTFAKSAAAPAALPTFTATTVSTPGSSKARALGIDETKFGSFCGRRIKKTMAMEGSIPNYLKLT